MKQEGHKMGEEIKEKGENIKDEMKSMAHNVGSGVKEVTNAVKQKVGTVTNNMKSDAHILGEDINNILGLGDYIIEFEITPNRPDCLSVEGLAKEVAVTFGKNCKDVWQYKTPEFKKLCSLYASKIEPFVTQYKIESLPIHGLFSKGLASTVMSFSEKSAKRLAVPVEAVKQDVDYELLYLRKPDGSRYCSPVLLKIKKAVPISSLK